MTSTTIRILTPKDARGYLGHRRRALAAAPARALFERNGFRRWGGERDAFRDAGASHDLWHMALELEGLPAEVP